MSNISTSSSAKISSEDVFELPTASVAEENVIYVVAGVGSFILDSESVGFNQISSDNVGGSYCPALTVNSNTAQNSILSTNGAQQFTIQGFALDQITDISIDDGNGNTATAIIDSISFTELKFTIQAPAVAAYTVTAIGECEDLNWQMTGAAITCLVPGDGATSWVNQSGDGVYGLGTYATVAGGGNGWNEGGDFGSTPANVASTAKFTSDRPINNPNGDFGFIGVVANVPAKAAGAVGRGLYFQNGQLFAYENGASLGNIGTYVNGDQFEIDRNVAGLTTINKNGTTIFTFAGNDTDVWNLAIVVFRNSAWRDIELCHS